MAPSAGHCQRITLERLLEHRVEILGATPLAALPETTACALLRGRIQIDLEPGVGNDDGADISADHHHRAAGRYPSLQRQQGAADRWMLGNSRDDRADLRFTHRPGDVFAVQPDVVEAAVLERWRPNRNLHLSSDPGERLLVVGSNAGSQRGKGNGPVQRSGVEEQRAKAVRQQACYCRFSGARLVHRWRSLAGDPLRPGRPLGCSSRAARPARDGSFLPGALRRGTGTLVDRLLRITRAPLEVERLHQRRELAWGQFAVAPSRDSGYR